ncbi:MAG TPA: 5'-nucleotidase, lipoprotein e(P4) family [Bacteroidales bacterium]|nr:5'-nucleotidase, lipoprotein e(P4) family [Bacteroidales bacterium]MDI9574523.1 5'-nucleotidase, lipoprotein e(P4) family [Bacteroidota bacterium]OQC59361.1 MAG: Lipoprotein E precursor [Bacteroidetes bacterium ADurb.Bin012]MBP9511782.1 5'-nucleotidase, lipoprotein e(P4) family [Bacteroidales bacterium]MBP9588807.1 5'-nucleotidase, lipoprotein e(P4) family [Bacteroidales bacterium]
MMKKFLIVLLCLVMAACQVTKKSSIQGHDDNDHLIMATLWFQQAAEVRALYYQAFHLAQLQLEHDLAFGDNSTKRAVVLDIDETVLDNSPHEGYLIQNGKSYPEGWSEWVSLAQAAALPGALDFINFAISHDVDVFYITNRKKDELNVTILNLRRLGFSMADSSHILVRTDGANKENRRQRVRQTHRIVLLIGDNLNDFSNLWEKTLPQRRNFLADSLQYEFGKRFIILPNPMYGDWENALYQYNYHLSPSQRDSIRRSFIKAFSPL